MQGHEVLLNIGGGVALLLWGARMVRTGILRAFGVRLRGAVAGSTANRAKAALTGLVAAALLQSATATALLTTSFVQRGLMTVAAGLAIMLGADVGSTLVVQAVSFDISAAAPVLILIGLVAHSTAPRSMVRQLGRASIGLGLMLMALDLVVGASAALRNSEILPLILAPLGDDPILALLLAALLTWVFHSSVAMVLLVMSFAAAGIVTPALAFALVLGANVGGGVVPVTLSLSDEPTARRVPLGNLAFRGVGALAALALLPLVSPHLAALGDDPARQVANFHTVFNLVLALVCLPLVGLAARAVVRLLPQAPAADDAGRPRYLDDAVIDSPTEAIAQATRETLRMADIVESMMVDVIKVFEKDDAALVKEISARDDSVDRLHEAIKLYLTRLNQNAMSSVDSRRSVELISFVTNLEHVGDIIDRNLLPLGAKKIRQGTAFSAEGWRDLCTIHRRAVDQFGLAITVLVSRDLDTARRLLTDKDELRQMELKANAAHLDRLREGTVASIETSALHLDMLREFKSITSHMTSIAYPILDSAGELRSSRLKERADSANREEDRAQEAPAGAGSS